MGELIVKKVSKRYSGGKFALKNVSFKVPSGGGIFALIGRNGAGKTTLVRILATQLKATSGSAKINGIDVSKNPELLRESIASVPQEARAVGWLTPKQFITSYLLWRGFDYGDANKKAIAALNNVGLSKYVNVQNQKLSGGLKRKVLVAMVMASDAKVLFLDEPTTGLDPISRTELWETLRRLKKDHFIFLTTHYLEEAERLADLIGVLDDGKLRAIGTLDELRKKAKYPYSIKILSKDHVEKPKNSIIVKGIDEHYQILTTENNAHAISNSLIKKGVKFSMSPLSLDDIFYYIVRKPIEVENYEEDGEW
ncbi:MAG: ABC transporter ATP-binding protein [Candidatus Micrarchaeota archaeon]|nr:ABC transporter ATP-binding protein [Candidatus Micrarchaeota archaeon]MDE1834056.1 ABC transporter ATP-binding protein [Candidatus Micrarchaeota archaeon]MDE1859172.1 ABC transporter ATP-binding protein [Candidatus Micrarchaeota archaeon]